MKLIDFHTHAFPAAIAARTLETLSRVSGIVPTGDGTRAGVVEEAEAAGAALAVVLNVATKPGQEPTINDTAQTLDAVLSGEGNTVYFGSVHPQTPDAEGEVRRAHARGLKGIKIHPDYQHTELTHPSYEPIFHEAQARGLVVVTHAGWDPLSPEHVHATPEMAAAVLKNFPRLKLVLAHFGGMHRYDEVEETLAGKYDNLYLDTAYSAGLISPKQAERITKRHGAHRVLFGSDFPWHTTRLERDFVLSLDLKEEEKERILYRNAEDLLGMTV
ncbi:MAG: amidohydrolase [Clostridia bacterium]|nr:amidohydrolase [Clostridia bacterium]